MTAMDDIEAKLQKVKLVREIEHVLNVLKGGVQHRARISALIAEDEASSERSAHFAFSEEESGMIFLAAEETLRQRYEALKDELK